MNNLLAHTQLQVHDRKSGRLNGIALAKMLGISPPQLAKMIDISPQGLRQNPTSPRIQARLGRIVTLVQRVRHMFGGDMEG